MMYTADLRVAAAIGGLSKYEQIKDLKAGSEVRAIRMKRRHLPARTISIQVLVHPMKCIR
jgi:hypothetical protein